jgi:threonine/homoserine/homoserine lactone efflux protein
VRELLLGASLGWAAGVSPGPLLTLVLTTTLQRGAAAGARVAITPLITDGPILVVGVLVASGLSDRLVLAISVVGAAYLVWLGIDEMAGAARATLPAGAVSADWAMDLRRGVLTNVLSPHPWLFWVGVGGPLLVAAWQRFPPAGVGFLAAFFGVIVGTKIALAVLVGRGRRYLTDRWYRLLVGAGGALLVVLGVFLAWSALG